jgi:hypothetical protein
MKKIPILLSVILALTGCDLAVDVEAPFSEPDLVLNSVLTPDSLLSARVSLNRYALDDKPFEKIDNAQVVVYEADIAIDTLTPKGRGFYKSKKIRPEPGKTYSIKASDGNHQPVTAVTFIPVATKLISAVFGETVQVDGNETTELKIKFKDDQAVKNYYQLIVEIAQEIYDDETDKVVAVTYWCELSSVDPAIQNDEPKPRSAIFKDLLFNGKEVELTFKVKGRLTGITNVILRTLNESLYDYFRTSSLQETVADNPFAQPVNVYNNVENGLGIFSGYSTSVNSDKFLRPVIINIAPASARRGDTIIITGENFILNTTRVGFQSSTTVRKVFPVRNTETEIEVIVPPSAVSGKILVDTELRVGLSSKDFLVIE